LQAAIVAAVWLSGESSAGTSRQVAS